MGCNWDRKDRFIKLRDPHEHVAEHEQGLRDAAKLKASAVPSALLAFDNIFVCDNMRKADNSDNII